jgi:hypothetical protein
LIEEKVMKNPGNPAKVRWFGLISALALLAAAAVLHVSARGSKVYAAQEKGEARAAEDQSTSLNDQTDLNVTVYNSNIALIRDVRNLALPSGTFRLKFMDIAATVNPATVHFRSLNDPEKLGVIEQNYEYDLLEPAKLLHKYVGKEAAGRGFLPRQQFILECRLRSDRRPRRQSRRSRWLGYRRQQQRHGIPQCAPPARRRRTESSPRAHGSR